MLDNSMLITVKLHEAWEADKPSAVQDRPTYKHHYPQENNYSSNKFQYFGPYTSFQSCNVTIYPALSLP
ncbi:Imitation switch two complex protein 1 [Fusarium oxysporum f. sp. albedinis]|nr:Imitation switch two complex protein 1 [Fusarium oxysporum f. sp. albedinis]